LNFFHSQLNRSHTSSNFSRIQLNFSHTSSNFFRNWPAKLYYSTKENIKINAKIMMLISILLILSMILKEFKFNFQIFKWFITSYFPLLLCRLRVNLKLELKFIEICFFVILVQYFTYWYRRRSLTLFLLLFGIIKIIYALLIVSTKSSHSLIVIDYTEIFVIE
jgi:hypothetical protein